MNKLAKVVTEEEAMVYCTKCGTKNADDATMCVNCGASLYGTSAEEDLTGDTGDTERNIMVITEEAELSQA